MGINRNLKKIIEFLNFGGLKYGDTIDKVRQIYGSPSFIYSNPLNDIIYYYYQFMSENVLVFTFTIDTLEIQSITFGHHTRLNALRFLQKHAIIEPKAEYLGMSMFEIIDVMGIPSLKLYDEIVYQSPRLEVSFRFPDGEYSLCNRIFIRWFFCKFRFSTLHKEI